MGQEQFWDTLCVLSPPAERANTCGDSGARFSRLSKWDYNFLSGWLLLDFEELGTQDETMASLCATLANPGSSNFGGPLLLTQLGCAHFPVPQTELAVS